MTSNTCKLNYFVEVKFSLPKVYKCQSKGSFLGKDQQFSASEFSLWKEGPGVYYLNFTVNVYIIMKEKTNSVIIYSYHIILVRVCSL